MIIKRRLVSADIERKILIGLISSESFCKQIYRMAKKEYFKSTASKIVFGWASDFYGRYQECPGACIQDIYNVEKTRLKDADADIVGQFMDDLSKEYEQTVYNEQYLLDQAKIYFRERSLTLLSEEIVGNIAKGRLQLAEDAVYGYGKVSQQMTNWFNPLSPENIIEIFDDDDSDRLFKFDGPLGDMCGWLERDWLIAIMAPMKRGKSWWLQELAVAGLLSGVKVSYFSLEMNKKAVSKRIYKRLTALASNAGEHIFPVFDCSRNQTNLCRKKQRACYVGIKDPGEEQPEFYDVIGYKPCTYCMNYEEEKENYIQAVWYKRFSQVEGMTSEMVTKKIKNFQLQFGDNLRVMAYPAFSASFDDIESDLDLLDFQEGFCPGMICIDYFDILNPGSGTGNFSERGTADYIWKRGKNLAAKRHVLVATVLQSNRSSIPKKSIEQEDVSEDIRKLAHVDLLLGLNQTKDEKDKGIMRIGVVAHRHEEFKFGGEVMALQSLNIGQPCLFSGWAPKE
ncbi:MAG: hypothetical protein WC143_04665 [Eubacteriales bacterium]